MWPGDALPQQGKTNWKFFYASGTDWQAYMKPPGASMIYIFMLASGGGGSRVANGAVTVSPAGAGGGCGGTSRMLIPATLLPDIIYVQPGVGGLGATSPSTNGTNGATSYVSVEPSTSSGDVIFQQDGGQASSNQTTGGAAGPIGTVTAGLFASLGLWFSRAGQSGGNGGNPSGANITSANEQGLITTAGTGGGRGSGSGGAISSSTGSVAPSVSPLVTSGANGSSGFQKGLILGPGLKSGLLYFTGGVGGNGNTVASVAGNGGDAAYGGGGGGGGASSNAGGTSGNGGNGGDGLIIIGTF